MIPALDIRHFLLALLLAPVVLSAQGIRILNGGHLIANHGNIAVKHHWVNDGKFTANGGMVVFNGVTQKIDGIKATAFYKMHVLTGSTTTMVSQGNTLRYLLKSDGTLYANDHFTLLAGKDSTALIDGSGSGSVLGRITMQGYLPFGFGYKYLGSPFQSATVGEMADDVDLNATFPSVYRHEENQLTNGWINYMHADSLLTPFRGYVFQMGTVSSPRIIDMNGVANNGNFSLNLNNNNQVFTRGFHLVSNPYPSPLNWDISAGWTKTNIDNAVYYFDADSTGSDKYGGIYKAYVNGVSSDGFANNYIPAMQAFFVHASDGSYPVYGTLGVNNLARVISLVPPYRKLNKDGRKVQLRLQAAFDGARISDAAVIYFSNNATEQFDKMQDALKLINTSAQVPSLYSITTEKRRLSIQAIAEPSLSMQIPLGIQTMQPGMINISASVISGMPIPFYYYLYDATTGIYQNLKQDSIYRISLPAGTHEQRLSIVFSKSPLQSQATSDPAGLNQFKILGTGQNRQLLIHMASAGTASVRIINAAGQIVFVRTYSQSGNYPLALSLPKGIYQATCAIGGKVFTHKIFIGE